MITKYDINNIPAVIENIPVVQDIEKAVECLAQHKIPIARFEFGSSMMPMLCSGQFCKITPIEDTDEIHTGDALFCNVNGYIGTHMALIKSQINPNETWYLIGTTRMEPIGWTNTVYGIATAIEHVVAEPQY